jgi:hypothetical protein
MSQLNISNNHPLIPSSNEVMYENKMVSINSEDRNILKYPSASDFEIELPQDYTNVSAINLSQWSFPSNIHVFTPQKHNVKFSFKMLMPYNPTVIPPGSILALIADAIRDYCDVQQKELVFTIESGFYRPEQIATELTRRFNTAVTDMVTEYIKIHGTPSELATFEATGYTEFVIVYNEITCKLWFGNKRDSFQLVNNSVIYDPNYQSNVCDFRYKASYQFWGLPAYLGLTREPKSSESSNKKSMRFFYGDVLPNDNGYWITTDSTDVDAYVQYIESDTPINLLGEPYIFVEIDRFNNVDETKPYHKPTEPYTNTNETNGYVNAAFAKIEFPLYQQFKTFDDNSKSIKIYNPPAERIRSIRIKLRYHTGELIDLQSRNYSITLNFFTFKPQILRSYNGYNPIMGMKT